MKHINYDEFILKYLPSTALEANDDSELSIKSKIKYLTRCHNVIKYLANLFIHLLMGLGMAAILDNIDFLLKKSSI